MSEDWDSVTRIGSKARGPGAGGVERERVVKGKSALNAASRAGAIIGSEKKYASANTKSNVEGQRQTMVANSDDIVKPKTVGRDVGQIIMRSRNEMTPKMTQKDLATKCNTTAAIIQGYESGNATPDQGLFNKIERALNVKLRGTDIGGPLTGPKKK
ncbi:hypothetical protein PV11_05050 [Exophiala sideris]|uniref:Multiprotein-bridging factor 1 n=1 Tax=Exophiala sideris TaxID=1016849 RepID=A0A0D1Z8C7_9EURO|nr:hypothetical protein PV11_05050 [Exophiala sideris]